MSFDFCQNRDQNKSKIVNNPAMIWKGGKNLWVFDGATATLPCQKWLAL